MRKKRGGVLRFLRKGKFIEKVCLGLLMASAVSFVFLGNAWGSEKSVVDMGGKSVFVPEKVERILITCYGGVTQEMAVLGLAEKIVGQPSMERFPLLLSRYPAFGELPHAGSFNNINVEEALKLRPDLVLASVTAEKGNQQLRDVGLPVVTVLTGRADMETLQKEFLLLGSLTGQEARARELVDYWQKILGLLEERLASLSQGERKPVYYMLGNPLHTNGSAWWGEAFIRTAGGINVASEMGKVRDVNVEQLLQWDPDVLILSSNEGKPVLRRDLEEDPRLCNLRALRGNSLYYCPIGAFWWDRPSPEAALGFLWLATTLYPERFSDVDLHEETKYFFEKFYEISLTEEQVEGFLDPFGTKEL